MNQQTEAENERYSYCLQALAECISKGVSLESLQTLRFEMGIDPKDYRVMVEANLRIKFERMKSVGL